MFKKLATVVALTASCGQGVEYKANIISFEELVSEKVPPSIRPHFVEFIEYCNITSKTNKETCQDNLRFLSTVDLVEGQIVTDNPMTIGLCEINVNRRITIRTEIFAHESLSFKALIWHELGHCLLNLDHIDDKYGIHIMNPGIPTEKELGSNWTSFVVDLFHRQKKFNKTMRLFNDEAE